MLTANPDCAPAIRLLALDDACNGDLPSALAGLTRALALQPDALWYRDLASALGYLDRWTEAQAAAQKAVDLGPAAESLALLARCLLNVGNVEQSLSVYSEAYALDAQSFNALIGLSRALAAAGKWEEALTNLCECVQRHPREDSAHEALATTQRALKRFNDEVASRRAVVALRPGEPAALARLGMALYETGELEACIACFEDAIRIAPHERYVHSNLLCAQVHHHAGTTDSLIRVHRSWGGIHCSSPDPAPHRNSRRSDRKLRIGYLTGECILNPTIFFFLPVLKRHDPEFFETYCYHARPAADSYTALYRSAAHKWRDVSRLSTFAVAEAIRADAIDILVDVSGHFPFGSLPVFSLRPAPVQLSNANYPCTTGLPAMDYILTDRWVCPPGDDGMYTETPLRIPAGYFTWEAQVEMPDNPELPAFASHGSVTFCLLQRPPKINEPVLDAVAEILRRVPGSTLLVHQGSRDLDNPLGPAAQRYLREFRARGIESERLRFEGGIPLDRHLKLLSTADIALDTFPYSGQTTTCECLYMGVPVVTLARNTHASRVSASILHRAECGAGVASTTPGYVEKAVFLASDLPALARMRGELRQRFLSSAVCNSSLVTLEIEKAFREIWRNWCEH